MVSPRPSCMSRAESTMTSPPSWRIATSKRDAGAGAGFLEDQRQGFAGQRARRTPRALEAGRDVQHCAQRRGIKSRISRKCRGRPPLGRPAFRCRALSERAHFAAALLRASGAGARRVAARRGPRRMSASVMISGGARRSTLSPAATVISPSATRRPAPRRWARRISGRAAGRGRARLEKRPDSRATRASRPVRS